MRRSIPLFIFLPLILSLAASARPVQAQVNPAPPNTPVGGGNPGDLGPGDGNPGDDNPAGGNPGDGNPGDDNPGDARPPEPPQPGTLPKPPAGFGQADPPQGNGKNDPGFPEPPHRNMQEIRLRGLMTDLSIVDSAKQDALVIYISEDLKASGAVKMAQNRLMTAIAKKYPVEQMTVLLMGYKSAVAADKDRRTAAQTALDAKIGYSLDSRLEAALYILGILGDGQPFMMTGRSDRPTSFPGNRGDGKTMGTPPNFGGGTRGTWGGMFGNWNNGNRDNGNRDNGNRDNGKRDNGNRDNKDGNEIKNGNHNFGGGNFRGPNIRTTAKSPQSGIVYGTVTAKGDDFIEVKMGGAASERYMPFWTAATGDGGGGYDATVLEAMTASKVGDTVRLEWVWSDHKRVVKLEPWTLNVTNGGPEGGKTNTPGANPIPGEPPPADPPRPDLPRPDPPRPDPPQEKK